MENASKALIIAAGVLLALILLGTFIYLFGQMSQVAREQDRVELMEQISEFNKQYESYQRNLLRGVDIASVCNKAKSYNEKNKRQDINEEIHVYVTLISDWDDFSKNTRYKMTDDDGPDWDNIRNNDSDSFYTFKIKYFKCDKIEYSKDTGKVTALYFTEIDVSDKFEEVES